MNTAKSSFSITPRQQGFAALALWGVVALLLLRHDIYGLDEGAARSLLLSWSIADQVASSVITFGMPDFRVLLFLPVGFLWTGKVFAAKALSVLLLALSAWLLYAWSKRTAGSESALLATGLLIISPLALSQLDSVSVGVYLLAALAVGAWLDWRYRANPRPFNGWFFALLFASAFAASLHPAGLALPLTLLLSSRTLPQALKYQRFFFSGVIFVTLFVLLLRMGWGDLAWFQNPLTNLSAPFAAGFVDEGQSVLQWLPGAVIIALAALVALIQHRALWSDITGRMLLASFILGAPIGDQAWGLIALSLLFYGGTPLLLNSSQGQSGGGFFRHRGLALVFVLACSTVLMLAGKAYFATSRSGTLSHQDNLIRTLAITAENERNAAAQDEGVRQHVRFIVASQWPGRTMLACRCDTFPLPPAAASPEAQLANLHSITYLIFDPKQTSNLDLVRNFAPLGNMVETSSLQPGGVMLHVREGAVPKPEGKAMP